ncbi:RraA family protein [Enterovirga rhinocerotis]|uniref:Putative 4-hydroxy-4-methyl-2-oxoglutarate aldolase n=1 Tax=Enterovirga rhinocerotis TaxID=1339210 RepID=A0A4R7BYS6_9HYPH|nr:RraA family protein [Enterovirga rhinocerotis]TDR90432.1 RraA family protein [Enterovirga rhinocerotis]
MADGTSGSTTDWPARFKTAATAIISDNLDRLAGAVGLRPFHRGGTMAGTAFTIRTAAGDNRAIHEALELFRPGDVLVVDGGGDTSRALIGEIISTIAQQRGAAGMVIDGAIRDAGALARSDFPVFARVAIHRGPYKNGPGETGVPVSIGGMVVHPGDIVVGDEDGVVAFSPEIAADLRAAVTAQEEKEEEILKSVRDGTYRGAYAK